MLFDLRPKTSRHELYGREEELEALHRLSRTEWIAILGRRMTGKTSLLKTFLAEVNGIYVNLSGVRSIRGLVEELMKKLKHVDLSLSLGPVRARWTRLAEDVFARLEGRIIGLDEAQDLPANYALRLFKKVWDEHRLTIIFTGSMMGLLHRLLEPGHDSPLYGRKPATIVLRPFTRGVAIGFLERGFDELSCPYREAELEEAVDSLGGYPGWLTYYGNLRCVRGMTHGEALENVYREARKILVAELERFLEARRNKALYVRLLRLLPAGWSELERALQVNRKVLRDALRSLERAMIVEKVGRTYTIPDPLMRRAVQELGEAGPYL